MGNHRGRVTAIDDELSEALGQKKKIYNRIKEVRALIDQTTDPNERRKSSERLRILREMYRDICEQVDRLRPPQEKRKKTPVKQTVQTGSLSFDFFERCGTAWSDIDGKTWSAFEDAVSTGSAFQASFLLEAVKSAMSQLTPTQQAYIMAYYNEKKHMPDIAQENNVTVSSVSRTIRRGLKRLESYLVASLSVQKFANQDGFDLLGFSSNTDVLTERQREYLYFLLTDGVSIGEIARYLELEKSTVSRGNQRIENNLSAVSSDIPSSKVSRKVSRKEWAGKSEKKVASMLGISPAVYYRCICRNETVGGIPRFAYEILRLRGLPAKEAAERLGVAESTVRKYWRKYEGVQFPEADCETYKPVPARKKPVDIRNLLYTERETLNRIGDGIDAETYQKMLAVSKK